VHLYWDQAVYKKPEKPHRVPWHQDNGHTYCEPQQYLTCWVALVDATVDNGCPWVLPRGHRAGALRHHWVKPRRLGVPHRPAGRRAGGGAVGQAAVGQAGAMTRQ
jgi:ectoine hydroxylase-related dioxygenase (phytanoyl-CoA dioxygenase family)